MNNIYFSHPDRVCMTYFQHLRFSLYLAKLMFIGSVKAVMHAFIPDIYIHSSSDIISKISLLIKNSGCKEN